MARGQSAPTTPEELADWLLVQIEDMEVEAGAVYEFARPQPAVPRGLFVQTLYAYMARCFSLLDRLSRHWLPEENNQSLRMVETLVHWGGIDREAANIGVYLWRHGLMHTAEARKLVSSSGQVYRWLLQWGPNELPDEQNWTFAVAGGDRILNLSLLRLMADLHAAIALYAKKMGSTPELRARAESGFRVLERRDEIRLA